MLLLDTEERQRGTLATLTSRHSQAFSGCLRQSQEPHKVQEAYQRVPECKKRAKFLYASLMPTIGTGVNLRAGGGLTQYCIIIVPGHIQNKPKLG